MKKRFRILLLTLAVILPLCITTVVLAAIIAPTVTTNPATYVAYCTARLNSTLTSDGGEACQVQFQYYTGAGVWADNETGFVTGYVTDDNPYVDVTGLTDNTTYHFRVQAKNTEGSTISGASTDFTTSESVGTPTGLKAYPFATNVLLTWTRVTGATETTIRYSETAYPATETGGSEAYEGVLSSYSVTGLTSGHTYYFSAWGNSGGNFSASYDTVMATTVASIGDVAEPGAPDTPTALFQEPDYTGLENLPFYEVFNDTAEELSIPANTFWMIAIFAVIGVAAFLIGMVSKSIFVAVVVVIAGILLGVIVGLLPLWMLFLVVIVALAIFQVGRIT